MKDRDVISATLPVDPVVAELGRMLAKWGTVNAAGVDWGHPERWTLESLAAADEFLTQDAAQDSNMRMLDADVPNTAAPAPAAEDPLDGVREAIDALIEHTVNDTWNTGSPSPGGQPRDPDVIGSERCINAILTEVRKLLAARLTP
jgi:hypothetical protein